MHKVKNNMHNSLFSNLWNLPHGMTGEPKETMEEPLCLARRVQRIFGREGPQGRPGEAVARASEDFWNSSAAKLCLVVGLKVRHWVGRGV